MICLTVKWVGLQSVTFLYWFLKTLGPAAQGRWRRFGSAPGGVERHRVTIAFIVNRDDASPRNGSSVGGRLRR